MEDQRYINHSPIKHMRHPAELINNTKSSPPDPIQQIRSFYRDKMRGYHLDLRVIIDRRKQRIRRHHYRSARHNVVAHAEIEQQI